MDMTEDLDIIVRLVGEMDERGQLSELDKDLLLDKIKALYERVKFGKVRGVAVSAVQNPSAAEASFVIESDNDDDYISADKVSVQPGGGAEADEVKAVFHRRQKSVVRALYEADGRIVEYNANQCRTSEPFFVENISFFDKYRRPLKRNQVQTETEQAVANDMPEVSSETGDTAMRDVVNDADNVRTVAVQSGAEANGVMSEGVQHKVFAETVERPHTIGDTLCDRQKGDLASAVAFGEHPSLRQMIGLNDKYLIVRDLFGGDTERYDAAISCLDSFDNIEDAVLYLNDNYECGPDSEAVKLLVGLLSRKLALV